jgi:hypothetical protein
VAYAHTPLDLLYALGNALKTANVYNLEDK